MQGSYDEFGLAKFGFGTINNQMTTKVEPYLQSMAQTLKQNRVGAPGKVWRVGMPRNRFQFTEASSPSSATVHTGL